MPETKSVNCRLVQEEADRIDEAAEEENKIRSEVIRRGIRYYMDENPDDLDAFE